MWINRQFRLQRFTKAVDAPNSAVSDICLISEMLKEASNENFSTPSIKQIREIISKKIEILAGCDNIGSMGIVLDASTFANIDFPEDDAINFKKNQHAKKGE